MRIGNLEDAQLGSLGLGPRLDVAAGFDASNFGIFSCPLVTFSFT